MIVITDLSEHNFGDLCHALPDFPGKPGGVIVMGKGGSVGIANRINHTVYGYPAIENISFECALSSSDQLLGDAVISVYFPISSGMSARSIMALNGSAMRPIYWRITPMAR